MSIDTALQVYNGAAESAGTALEVYDGALSSFYTRLKNINALFEFMRNSINRSTIIEEEFVQQVEFSEQAENKLLDVMKAVENVALGLESGFKQVNAQQAELNSKLSTGSKAGNGLLDKVKDIASNYLNLQNAKNIFNAADELTQNNVKLNQMKDTLHTSAQLSQEIFQAAERSRSSYADTMANATKLGLETGDTFKNNDEVIGFTELMNKNVMVSGANEAEQAGTKDQITQAMTTGSLKEDGLASIKSNAPLLVKSIEDYMRNVKQVPGTIDEWASQGLISADVIKAAMFNTSTEVDNELGKIPITWAQMANSIKSSALVAFLPVLAQINAIATSDKFEAFKNGLITGIQKIALVVSSLFGKIVRIVNLFAENWGIIRPAILGVVSAMAIYNLALTASNIKQGIANILGAIAKIQAYSQAEAVMANAAAYDAETVSAAEATIAQTGFNTALLACPLTWIVGAIILLIALIYIITGVVNHFMGSSLSATGLIAGGFLTLAAVIGNVVIGLLNGLIQMVWGIFVKPFIGIIEWVLNIATGGFDSFAGAVANLLGQIISVFLSLGKVVTAIIDAIFGTNWTEGLKGLQDKVLSWGKNDNAITFNLEEPAIDRLNYGDAFNTGNAWGTGISDSIKNMFKPKNTDNNADHTDMYNNTDMNENIAATANNTGEMARSVNISDEDLQYLQDVAERDAINRFTTAEIKVDMTNHNNIGGTRDIDGIVDYLRNTVEEQMSRSAEGVN